MLFNTYTFVIFFTVVLFLHNLPFHWRTKKFNLLWASYLFYAAWNPPFVFFLILSTITDWLVAKKIYLAKSKSAKRYWLFISLGINLGLLGYFKYSNFVLETLGIWLTAAGIPYQPARLDIILPVGISFYTFQTLSYTLDIYKGKMKPWDSFLDFAMYVTFFPQLVAGPIVRAAQFLPQCKQWDKPSTRQLGWGLTLMLIGIFQKQVLADGVLAPYVDMAFSVNNLPSPITAWAGSFAFSGQLLFDFAGYSTTAIGAAMCLGFHLPDNFNSPFAAIGFIDFWKRWHISLSSWLRDYVFYSLPGGRRSIRRIQLNSVITMIVSGLWHGASWNFVIWGALNGMYQAVEIELKRRSTNKVLWKKIHVQFFLAALTFTLVVFTSVFFRTESFEHAMRYYSSMLGFSEHNFYLLYRDIVLISVVMGTIFIVHWMLRNTTLEAVAVRTPWWLKSFLIAIMIISIVMMPGEERAFIYFQF